MPNRNQSKNAKIRHIIRTFVRQEQYDDYLLVETVCQNSREDVYKHLETNYPEKCEGLKPSQIPDYVEKGIVLTDSRGRGAFQK